jgi:hypothetical protein
MILGIKGKGFVVCPAIMEKGYVKGCKNYC